MSYSPLVDKDGHVIGDVRICYVYLWDDPQWCERNGFPDPATRRSERAKRGAETRRRNRESRARNSR